MFFFSASSISFHSGEYAAYVFFFYSFSCSNPPERHNPRHPAEEAEKASDRKRFHVKCNFIMLIYRPNLNLNCGKLCSIMFASPVFKGRQLFL